MATTLHDVAKLAGVSDKTVSNVVNDYPHIRQATRERVLAAIAELGYRPNLSAREPALRAAPASSAWSSPTSGTAVLRRARRRRHARAPTRHGLSVLIEQTGGDRERELEMLRGRATPCGRRRPLQRRSTSATRLAVCRRRHPDGAARRAHLQRAERPRDDAQRRGRAGRDRAPASRSGRRRIVAFGAHERRGHRLGRSPARRAIAARWRPPASRSTRRSSREAGLWHRFDGADAMRALLDAGVQFDAVVAFNDALALGAMRVLRTRRVCACPTTSRSSASTTSTRPGTPCRRCPRSSPAASRSPGPRSTCWSSGSNGRRRDVPPVASTRTSNCPTRVHRRPAPVGARPASPDAS